MPDLEQRLRKRSMRARGLLDPFVLPRIDRPQVWNRYLAAIARTRGGAGARLIPVLGGAGLGKSTLVGAVWDAEHEHGPTTLITCSEVSLPLTPTAASVDLAFGEALGVDVPLSDACRSIAGGGSSLLLIDTLDLVLTQSSVIPLRHFFHELVVAGVTVLFTCRDFEYERYFVANRQYLPQLDRSVDGQIVPPFTMDEVEEAAHRFAEAAHGAAVATRFARSIVELAADRRPIRELAQNPLLLAMLCDLYAGGKVPPELTVAQLYETFWSSHVAVVRKPATPAAAAPRKERICLGIAARILDASGEHFVDSVPSGDLRSEREDATGVAAMQELLSEGVVREQISRLAFFHQTFAEFVIARLLTESAEARRLDALLDLLRTGGEAAHLHLWPVLRQLLVLVDFDRFRDIARTMPSLNLAAFRAVTMAAATRRDGWELLAGLGPTALAAGSEFQAAYLVALEIAGADKRKEAEPLLIELIAEGDSRAATLAAKTLGDFAADEPSISLDGVLTAIDRRAGNFTRNELQAAMLDGLASSLVAGDVATTRLRELRTLLPRLTAPARERLMHIHAGDWTSIAEAEALLAALRAEPLPKTLHHAAAVLLGRTVKAAGDGGAPDLLTLLGGAWQPGWEFARGYTVASLMRASPELADDVVRLMLTSEGRTVGACAAAVAAAAEKDVAMRVTSALLAEWDLAAKRIRLTADVVQSIAGGLPEEMRRSLRERLAPLVSEPDRTVVVALAALASTAQDEQTVLSFVEGMTDDAAFDILPPMVRAFRPPLGTVALRTGIARVQRALPRGAAENARVRLVNLLPEPERSDTLTRLCEDPRFPERARRASAMLAVQIAPDAALSALVPVLARPQQNTRLHVVQALARAVEKGGTIASEDLEAVAAYLRDERDSAVLQEFFELATSWIRARERVPEGVLIVCQSAFVPRLRDLSGGAQRAAVVFLKWAASLCDPETETFQRIRAMILDVFRWLDFQRFGDGESEGLEMLSHVARAEPSFARTLIDTWEKSVLDGHPVAPYTLRSLVHLLNRTRERHLYNQILLHPVCPPVVRSMILKHLDV